MKIKKYRSQKLGNQNIQEGIIIDGIKQHIKTSNFPKKLMLKKFDLIIDNYNKKIDRITKLITASKKTKEVYFKNSESLKEKNQREKNILLQKLL